MSKTLEIAKKLISIESITPNDNGCIDLIESELASYNFKFERFDSNGVSNLYAKYGSSSPLLVFAGHTDVVPTGPIDQWSSDPFIPTEREGNLFGRGAADMKTSLAAFIVAIQEFLEEYPNHFGSIGLFITSDEEGVATDGTKKLSNDLFMTNNRLTSVLLESPQVQKFLVILSRMEEEDHYQRPLL